MAISKTFKVYVHKKDKRNVRMVLKDSLLLDKTFKDFDDMSKYAIKNGISDLYDKHNAEKFLKEEEWTENYLNKQKIRLDFNFSEERIDVLKKIIRKLYPNKKLEKNSEKNKNSYINIFEDLIYYFFYSLFKISKTFKEYVCKKDKRNVRMILKDSLLLDKTFKDFDYMSKYAIKNGISDLYDEHNAEKFLGEEEWTEVYLNKQKIRLDLNFSKERIEILKKIIRKLYKPVQNNE